MHACIDKSKKKKVKKDDRNHTAAEKKGPLDSPYTQKVLSSSEDIEPHVGGKFQQRGGKNLLMICMHQTNELESNFPPQ